MRALAAFAFFVFSTWLFSAPACAEKRVALVVGNSAYQNTTRLANPANDANAMAATFRSAGFDVVELRQNLGVREMRRAFRDFADNVRGADIAIVYFAGHGIEIDGTNYVIPVDAVLERDIDAFDEAIPLERMLTVIEPARQLRLVILDACRDNPFNKTMRRTIGSRAIGRGLAKVEPISPNTLVAFAAKAGSSALDGDTPNSPFTAALVKHLTRPGLDLRKAFGFTRDDVLKATGNRQEPFIYGSLGGDDVALVPAAPSAPAVSAAPADPNAATRRDYELAERIGTVPVWDSFIANYPSGFYTDLARAQRNKLLATAASAAAEDKARAAAEEQKRLAAEGARAGEQAKAAAAAKAAEEARIAAEKKRATEEAKVAEAERAKAAAQARAAEDVRIAAEKKAKEEAKAAEQKAAEQQAAVQRKDDKAVGQLAALPPPAEAAKPSTPAAVDLPRLLQSELRRVGCYAGTVDGNWNAASQKSLGLFNKSAKTKFDVALASIDALDVVRGKTSRVCPLVCDYGYRTDGDNCVKIICRSGYELGDDNTCERRETRQPAPKPAPEAQTPQPRVSNSGLQPCSTYCKQKYGGLGSMEGTCLAYAGRCDHSR